MPADRFWLTFYAVTSCALALGFAVALTRDAWIYLPSTALGAIGFAGLFLIRAGSR